MFVGILEADVLLPDDVASLKDKRRYLKSLVAALRKKLEVSAAEAGHQELLRRTLVGVAVVSGDAGHVAEVLAAAERLITARPELEVLAVRARHVSMSDLP